MTGAARTSHGNTGGERFNTAFHGLRGVASVMVLAAHILNGMTEHVYSDRAGFVEAAVPFWNLGTYGVYLFFAISGFVILPSTLRYSPGDFAFRRFVRIYPLFLFATLLYIVLATVTGRDPNATDPATVFFALTFLDLYTSTGQLTPNAWSLSYEVAFYALTGLAVYFAVKRPNRAGLVLSLVLAAVFTFYFPATIFFLIGIAVRLAHDRSLYPARGLTLPLELAALVALAAIASQGHFGYYPDEMGDPVAQLTIVATAIYFYLASRPGSVTEWLMGNRVCLYLGTISYSLYLIHPYAYISVRMAFLKLGVFTDNLLVSGVIFYAAVVFLSIAVTHVIHLVLEVGPYKMIFRRRVFEPGNTRETAGADGKTVDNLAGATISAHSRTRA